MAPPLGTKYVSFKDKDFGKKLRKARMTAGFSMASVCATYSLSSTTLINLERGVSRSIAKYLMPNIKKICTKLKVAVPETVDGRPYADKGERKYVPVTKKKATVKAKKITKRAA